MRRLVLAAALILPPLTASAQTPGLGSAAYPTGGPAALVSVPSREGAAWPESAFEPSVTGSLGPRGGAAEAEMPLDVVRRCRRAIVAAAIPFGVAQVDAAGAGPLVPVRDGYVAPIEFSIVYVQGGARETRAATIACHLDKARRVTGVR